MHNPSSPVNALIDLKKVEQFLNTPSDYGKPWYGQLMAGPQMLAYMLQLNYWRYFSPAFRKSPFTIPSGHFIAQGTFQTKVTAYNKVTLTGECADEIFGGYPWFHKKEAFETDAFPWSQSMQPRTQLLKDEIKENVFKTFPCFFNSFAQIAVTRLESTPPDKKVLIGISESI